MKLPVKTAPRYSYITSDVRGDDDDDDDDDALPIMEEPSMSPGQWLHPPDGAVMVVVDAQEELHLDYFRRKRDIYIDEVLSEVSCQQQVREHQQLFDYVDLAVLHDETKLHVCSQCLYASKYISSGICPNCKMSFIFHCPDYDPYKSANDCHYGKSTVTIGKPVMVNPCSMDSIATVVNDIFFQIILHGQRHGLMGFPIGMAVKVRTRRMVYFQSFCSDLAPVPLSIFRSNLKFDENSKHSSVKCTWPITTKFCTRHDSVTVVTCAKYRCDRSNIFETRAFWMFIEFRIRSKYA